MKELNGFIKLHRKLVAWGWYQDSVVKDTFLHLILTASFSDTYWRGTTIKRGQLVTSYKNLSADLGFSVQQIRTALNKLKSTHEITVKTTNKYTIITVENWDKYQLIEDFSTSETTRKSTNEQQTTNKQSTNNQQHRKNVKNNKNVNNKKRNNKEKSLTSPTPLRGEAHKLSEEAKERLRNYGVDEDVLDSAPDAFALEIMIEHQFDYEEYLKWRYQ